MPNPFTKWPNSAWSNKAKQSLIILLTLALAPLLIALAAPAASADAPWTVTASQAAYSSFAAVSCPGAGICVAVGQQNTSNLGYSGDSLIERSTDGGHTWNQESGTPPSTILTGVSCPSVQACWAAGYTNNNGTNHAEVLQSTNGGQTWAVEADYTAFPSPPSTSYKPATFTGITCPTTQSCYTWGTISTLGTIYASSNGGSTWSYAAPAIVIANQVSTAPAGISCWAAQSCMVAWTNDGYIPSPPEIVDTTTNGGASWNNVTIPATITKYRAISCPAANTCTIVGNQSSSVGMAAQTTNGGASWAISSTSAADLRSVSCAAVCMAVGVDAAGSPVVTVQTNPNSWSALSAPPFAPSLDAVSCSGSDPCVVAGLIPSQIYTGSAYAAVPTNNNPAPQPPPPPQPSLPQPIVSMAATPDGGGYWLANAQGGVSTHGNAVFYGSMANHPLNAPIAHIVATPSGHGYWLVASDGGTFNFGDAGFYGSMGASHLNAPVVDIAPTPSGHGYWLVASDGGIFSFGDAPFYGSMGGNHLNKPVVGIAADPLTGGYWEVATDGGIFAFHAPFYGSTGAIHLNQPVNSMAVTPSGHGYWFVASDGGIFAFGDAQFHGSMGGTPLNKPVVGMAADNATGGYWLVASDGGIFSFDAPFYGAD